jgi:hypothetical protein
MWTGPSPSRRSVFEPDLSADFATTERGGIHVLIRIQNRKDKGLGLPLPAGRVRVYKADPADGAREFIGEDVIDHTPVDEPLQLAIGTAFDIVGERKQTKFELDGQTLTEAFEVSIRNRKTEAARVTVRESMYRWVNWKVLEASEKWSPVAVKAVDFVIDLPPGAEKKITYTVKYSW